MARELHKEFDALLSRIQSYQHKDNEASCSHSCPQSSSKKSCPKDNPENQKETKRRQNDKTLKGKKWEDRHSNGKDYKFDPKSFGQESEGSSEEDGDGLLTNCMLKKPLHKDIPFNVDEKNCLCQKNDKKRWVVHKVYKGEQLIPQCDLLSNNEGKLTCYRVSVKPDVNFQARMPSKIRHRSEVYEFDGYLLLSHYSLAKIPDCSFLIYERKHVIKLHPEPIPRNFCVRDLELFHKLVFGQFFEISDWNVDGDCFTCKSQENSCPIFHFLPRFVRRETSPARKSASRENHISGEKEKSTLLSMSHVLDHLLKNHKPLVKHKHLRRREYDLFEGSRRLRENLVFFPGRKPPCIRLDDLRFQSRSSSREAYPEILHYSTGSSRLQVTNARLYKQLKRKRDNLRYILEDCVLPDKTQLNKLRETERKLEEFSHQRNIQSQSRVWLSSQDCYRTGINSDIFQHTILLYVAVDHIRYHKSLNLLEERIKYNFNDKLLLEKALRHVSLSKKLTEFTSIRVSSFNCGFLKVNIGDGVDFRSQSRKRGVGNLSCAMSRLAETEARPSTLCHNESLEFLGDSVLEITTTSRLFFLFGNKTEGELSRLRALLVSNAHLANIAKKLELEDFMLFGHRDWSESRMDHMLANCVEAILAAVYLDGGYNKADELLQFLHFVEQDLREIWMNPPKHGLQARAPDGDRHLIEISPRLQDLVKLEEQLGITFNHISLLARAFSCSADASDALTGGNNQRLELLGDSILKYIISEYVYQYFPDHQEGHLTLLRTSLVNAKTQATVFKELGLDEFIDYAMKSTMGTLKIYANVFEAFIGAVYVDKGMNYCRKICEVTLFPKLKTFILNQDWLDPKSKLQNCCAYVRSEENKLEFPTYHLLEVTGPVPYRSYKAAVYFQKEQIGVGIGKTIRSAEVAAARNALESNHFEVQEKQKRDIFQRYGFKRLRPDPTITDSNCKSAAKEKKEEEEEWEPKWIFL